MIKSDIEWHVLQRDPYDLPSEEEKVLVTVDTVNNERRVLSDVYLKYTDDGYAWCTLSMNWETNRYEQIMVWEPVTAWCYYPDPCPI